MGAQCLASTPNERYSHYLQNVKISELKDLWETVKLYKIKKLYDAAATKHPQYENHFHLPFQSFKGMFPEFARYENAQIKRIFEIFDLQSQGFVDWNAFFSVISIAYFASEDILSLLMFMTFDNALAKELDRAQLMLMIDLNAFYIRENEDSEEHAALYEPEQVLEELLKDSNGLVSIDVWQKEAVKYFDFGKYRKFYNIFAEEKLEKELAKNFNQWNTIYDEQKEKYISYLVNFKWFQSWKIYIQEHYNQTLNIYSAGKTAKSLNTIRKAKTYKKKTTMKSSKKKIGGQSSNAGYRQIKIAYTKFNDDDTPQQIKNIDFLHSNFGEKPRQICNSFLEGEFQEVLRPQISENMDYVLVSEAVWNNLKNIYDGFPEFRRTGFDVIELYPKIVKIYSSFFKGQIDYSSEVIREVSAYLRVDHLLINSIEIPENMLSEKCVFYKAIGMPKWEQIQDLSFLFTQLTPQIVIFLIYIDRTDKETFKKNYMKIPKEITDINVGDFVKHKDPKTKAQKTAIFMGKNTQGKYIIHYHKTSYIYDICLMESELVKQCQLSPNKITEIQHDKKLHTELTGLPNSKGTGFINSVITHLLANKVFKGQLSLIDNEKNDCIVHVMSQIQYLLNQKKKIESRDILDMIEIFMPAYQNFEVTMCPLFLDEFMGSISGELQTLGMKDIVKEQFSVKTKRTIRCMNCQQKTEKQETKNILSVSIPETKEMYYQIIFVPSILNPKINDIKRYGFKLPQGSTFKAYLQQFEALSQLSPNHYIIAEVYGNNIIKNYTSINKDSTLEQLRLREGDAIYAYELYTDFDKFVAQHYSNRQNISDSDVKVDQFIDCKHSDKGWIFGKVTEIEYLPYTQSTIVKVQHKFTKNESWQISYDVFDGCVAKFPLRSYRNSEQYHLRLQQRYFNEASNQMQLCNMPLVCVLTSWMRWRQFFFLVYQQVKKFIHDDYVFVAGQGDEEAPEKTTKLKTVNMKHKTKKNVDQQKVDRFKEYKNSNLFPYSLHLVDYQGRCAICFKFLKSLIFKGQNELYCEGCQLSQTEPVAWQVKPADLMVCVDWKDLSRFKKQIVKDHSSYANLLMSKKNDKQNLQNCLKGFGQCYVSQEEDLCCNQVSMKENVDLLLGTSEIVPIYIERIVEQSDGFKKIIHKPIQFPLVNLKLLQSSYNLTGVTTIEGDHRNIKYKTYLQKQQNEWYEYDGELVRIVDKKVVQKGSALVLYYKRAGK